MADLSNAGKAAVLDNLTVAAQYVGYFTAVSDYETGAATEFPAANGYARTQMDPGEWTAAADAGGGYYEKHNTAAQETAASTAAWAAGAPAIAFGLFAAASGGTPTVIAAIAAPYQQAVTGANQVIRLPAAALVLKAG